MANFFSLSQELRNMIYDYVFDKATNCVEPVPRSVAYYRQYPKSTSHTGPHCYLRIVHTESNQDQTKQPEFTSLSLLRTNRQIYTETQALFYEKYTFYFSSPRFMLDTFKVIGRMALRKINSIYLIIQYEVISNDDTIRALQSISHLESHGSLRTVQIVLPASSIA
ncbi:hypothetical protein B7494_g4528 [Chlorociboria aeruginascens]|nr:hypothetical protein B7494_g4528 [Chlorociboria aeruginascens]